MISVHFQGKPFNITVIQVYALTSNAEEAEVEWFYEDLQDLLELTPKKMSFFVIGDWNAKVGSQETPGVTGKFEVVKQEMARMNIDSLGISELKWTGMGEFNSDDHYIYYCGHEFLRRNGIAIIVNKRVQNAVLGCSLKNDRMMFVSKANHSISQ